MRDANVHTAKGKFGQTVEIGPHRLAADELPKDGGDDTGPNPHEFLLAALGACTSMTLKVYADRKGWPLTAVDVKVSAARDGAVFRIHRDVKMEGPLDAEQRARLLEIAGKCPVHKTLTGEIAIDTLERAAERPAAG